MISKGSLNALANGQIRVPADTRPLVFQLSASHTDITSDNSKSHFPWIAQRQKDSNDAQMLNSAGRHVLYRILRNKTSVFTVTRNNLGLRAE